MLQIRLLDLEGLVEITPAKICDNRGYFSETYNKNAIDLLGTQLNFVQDNHTFSATAGVLRGLHYQLPPKAQDKLVRVASGRIFDVAVDLRSSSKTFGHWLGLELSAKNWNQLLVPAGFAHGYLTLEPNTEVIYKVTQFYSPEYDRSIRYDDRELGICWPNVVGGFLLSEKDKCAPPLSSVEIFASDFESKK